MIKPQSYPNLTEAELAVNAETWRHIHTVQKLLTVCQHDLSRRSLQHDQSKLSPPEVNTFAEFTPKLKNMVYGSKEYTECLAAMGPALRHHYANNSHHPEYHLQGVDDMSLLDLLEMLLDWMASSTRTKLPEGKTREEAFLESLDIQAKRFGIEPQLLQILAITAKQIAPMYEKEYPACD